MKKIYGIHILEAVFIYTFENFHRTQQPLQHIFTCFVSASAIGLVFHLKTRGLAKKSHIEEILIIFEKYLYFFRQRFGSSQQHFPIGYFMTNNVWPRQPWLCLVFPEN
jgi:hypothetical protein